MRLKSLIFILACTCCACVSMDKSGESLSGKSGPSELQKFKWFRDGYADYHPDKDAVRILSTKLHAYRLVIFGGVWCPDTRAILPGFYKAIDEAGYPRENTTLYLLDMKKRSPEKIEEKYQIHSVPCFIILKDGVEAGRIIEIPKSSIEADLAGMIR